MSSFALIVWVMVLGLLALLGWGIVNNDATRPIIGEPAPDFEIQFFDGYTWQNASGPIQFSDFQGQVVVINFWASWCVECRVEAADLENTWQAYRDKGVVFLGVAYVDTEPRSLAFLQEFGSTYPNAPDLRSEISRKYQVTAVPETFIIDQTGVMQQIFIGPVTQERLVAVLDELITP